MGDPLDVHFEALGIGEPEGSVVDGPEATSGSSDWRRYRIKPCTVTIPDLDDQPGSVSDAYLRLHLLSHRLVRPNEINLGDIFSLLPNVCWTSTGPVDVADVSEFQIQARRDGGRQVPEDVGLRRPDWGENRRR
jgi:2,3,4,5-tetrahydropyridine-2-carboxylate N-succinyltransferase